MLKNSYLWTVVLEKTPESPLDSKEIKPVNLNEDQPWIGTGRTDAEAEAPVFRSSDVNSQLTGKDPDSGKDWGQEEKGVTEGEMVGRYHQLNGHEFEQTPGDGEGQGGLACCSLWSLNESDTTEQLNRNWTELYTIHRLEDSILLSAYSVPGKWSINTHILDE